MATARPDSCAARLRGPGHERLEWDRYFWGERNLHFALRLVELRRVQRAGARRGAAPPSSAVAGVDIFTHPPRRCCINRQAGVARLGGPLSPLYDRPFPNDLGRRHDGMICCCMAGPAPRAGRPILLTAPGCFSEGNARSSTVDTALRDFLLLCRDSPGPCRRESGEDRPEKHGILSALRCRNLLGPRHSATRWRDAFRASVAMPPKGSATGWERAGAPLDIKLPRASGHAANMDVA